MSKAAKKTGTFEEDDPAESQRFVDTAREVEAHATEAEFEAALAAVSHAEPSAPKPSAKRTSSKRRTSSGISDLS